MGGGFEVEEVNGEKKVTSVIISTIKTNFKKITAVLCSKYCQALVFTILI